MPMTAQTYRFSGSNYLKPAFPEKSKPRAVNLAPNATYAAGEILLPATASVSSVQTITAPGSGTYVLSGVNPITGATFATSALAFGANDAAVLAALNIALAASGGGTVTVSSLAVTFGGALAAKPVPLMTASAGSVAMTTAGTTAGQYGKYSAAGSGTPTCINVYPCTTDASGNVSNASQAGGEYATAADQPYAMAYFGNSFFTKDLTGLDTNAVTKLGRLASGTNADGILEVIGS